MIRSEGSGGWENGRASRLGRLFFDVFVSSVFNTIPQLYCVYTHRVMWILRKFRINLPFDFSCFSFSNHMAYTYQTVQEISWRNRNGN